MNDRRVIGSILSLALILYIFFKSVGVYETMSVFWQVFKGVSSLVMQLLNTSILNILFKHRIVYYIVGVMLAVFQIPKGKEGHYIGVMFYFLIGLLVEPILNFLSTVI